MTGNPTGFSRGKINKYTMGRWGERFKPGQLPEQFESCDWRLNHGGPTGRYPRYWAYVKHGACHWIANFTLRLANLSEPGRPWRIVTNPDEGGHTTVWDGRHTLFDFNYQALGFTAPQCFAAAYEAASPVLPVGRYLRTYMVHEDSVG